MAEVGGHIYGKVLNFFLANGVYANSNDANGRNDGRYARS